ncbi:MAG: caspase family protein [Cyclobacteriaceae bacterium]
MLRRIAAMKKLAFFLFLLPILAYSQADQEGYKRAIERYSEQIKVDPFGPSAGILYMQRGLAHYHQGEHSLATKDLTTATERSLTAPYRAQAFYYCGLSYEATNDLSGAGRCYSQALDALNQDEKIEGRITWDQILLRRIAVRKRQGFDYAALSDLKIYRSLNRADATIQPRIDSLAKTSSAFAALNFNAFRLFQTENRRLELAYQAFQQGNYDDAVSMAGLEVNREPLFYAIRGYSKLAARNNAGASSDFENAVQRINDFNYKGLSNFYLAFARYEVGDHLGAVAAITLAGRMFTSEKSLIPSSFILRTRAEWNEQLGRKASAYNDYELLINVLPGDKQAMAKLNELKDYKDKQDDPIESIIVKRPHQVVANTTTSPSQPGKKPEIQPAGNKEVDQKLENITQHKNTQESKLQVKPAVPELSEFERAILRFTQLIDKDPSNASFYMQRGIAYFQNGQYQNAIPDLTTCLKTIDPQYRNQALYFRAQSYAQTGNVSNGLADINAILQATASGTTVPVVAGISSKDLLLQRALWQLQTGNSFAAFSDLKRYRKLDASNAQVNAKYDSLLAADETLQMTEYDVYSFLGASVSKSVERAKELFSQGEFEQSYDALIRDATRTTTPNSPANLALGYSAILKKNPKQAVVFLNEYLKGDLTFEQRALANFYAGYAWGQDGNLDEAINAYTNSLKVFTTERSQIPATDILLKRAKLFEKQGFSDMAYTDYSSYLQMRPGDSAVRTQRDALKPATPVQVTLEKPTVQPAAQPKVEEKPRDVNPLKELFKDEKRYALVIGNSNYPKEVGSLVNPRHDAMDMAEELRKSNFEVTLLLDATYRQIEVAAGNFYKTLVEGPKDQTVGLFYYSGHGLQYEGENLIVPVDALALSPSDIPYVCNKVDKILGRMEAAATRMSIMILDACRSNPFPVADRSFNPGLAQVRPARGSYVAFATAPGSTASDGTGRNGLYTQELLNAMRKPNLTIEQVFKEVRRSVSDLSAGRQQTWDNSNIIGEFYFKIED